MAPQLGSPAVSVGSAGRWVTLRIQKESPRRTELNEGLQCQCQRTPTLEIQRRSTPRRKVVAFEAYASSL